MEGRPLKLTKIALPTSSGNDAKDYFMFVAHGNMYLEAKGQIIVRHDLRTGDVSLDRKLWQKNRKISHYRDLFLSSDSYTTKWLVKTGRYKLEDLN